MKRRKMSRLRFAVWLMVCLVVAAVLAIGGALVIADRSRGPAGPGVEQIMETWAHEHWQRTLQDRGVPEARALRLYRELGGHMRELRGIVRVAYGPPSYPGWDLPSLLHVVPIWEPSRFSHLPENFNETFDYEKGRKNNAAYLQMARDEGVLGTLLEIERFRGASVRSPGSNMVRDPVTSAEASLVASLLGVAYIEAVEAGDETGAAAAAQALTDAALVFAEMGPWHASPTYPINTRSWLVRSTIELGLMTPSLARSLLDQKEPVDVVEMRLSGARLFIVNDLQWIAEGGMSNRNYRTLYGVDGRIRFMPALQSVFRSVPVKEDTSLALPRIGITERHATLEEFAEYLDKYAEACEAYFVSSRADRRLDMLLATPQTQMAGVAFPVGTELLWLRMARFRDSVDEIELLQNTTVIALAIEVYRGEHGEPPASLEDLVPGVLGALPRNTWNNGGDWLYAPDAKSPLGYKLTIPNTIGPHAEGVLPGEWPYQPGVFSYHESEFYIMPSRPYDFGP